MYTGIKVKEIKDGKYVWEEIPQEEVEKAIKNWIEGVIYGE